MHLMLLLLATQRSEIDRYCDAGYIDFVNSYDNAESTSFGLSYGPNLRFLVGKHPMFVGAISNVLIVG